MVLTGQGQMFSAGVNLMRLSEGGAAYVRRFLPALHRLYDTVFFFPKPVVAAVNGHAIAGGCVLECCADKRIAARGGGRIGVTELLVGVPFPPLAFEIMRFASPPRYLADGMFSGATFTPDVALARGLVDELAEPRRCSTARVAAAETLAALSPPAFAQTKQQIRQPVADAMERHGGRVAAAAEGDLDRAGNARPHPRLRRAHVQEGLVRFGAGELDDLAPLLGLVGDEFSVVRRRCGKSAASFPGRPAAPSSWDRRGPR